MEFSIAGYSPERLMSYFINLNWARKNSYWWDWFNKHENILWWKTGACNTKCKTSDTGKNVLMKTDNCEHIQNTKGSGRIWYMELNYRSKYHRLIVKNIALECGFCANTLYTCLQKFNSCIRFWNHSKLKWLISYFKGIFSKIKYIFIYFIFNILWCSHQCYICVSHKKSMEHIWKNKN